MKEKLNEHIRVLFADAERRSPGNPMLAELKEELLLNTLEKYDHLVATGRTPEAAYVAALNGIGDIEGLLNDVIGAGPSRETVATAASAVRETASPEAGWDEDEAYDDEAYDDETYGDETYGDETYEDEARDEEERAVSEDGGGSDGGDEKGGKGKRPPRSPWYKLVSGIIWTAVLCAYFAISFTTHAWHVTWLLFIMGIAADNVAEGIFDLRR